MESRTAGPGGRGNRSRGPRHHERRASPRLSASSPRQTSRGGAPVVDVGSRCGFRVWRRRAHHADRSRAARRSTVGTHPRRRAAATAANAACRQGPSSGRTAIGCNPSGDARFPTASHRSTGAAVGRTDRSRRVAAFRRGRRRADPRSAAPRVIRRHRSHSHWAALRRPAIRTASHGESIAPDRSDHHSPFATAAVSGRGETCSNSF